ncbi:CoA-transferase [Streptomyces virginiae]
MSTISSLDEAVRNYVRPGAHLHFPATPSRANAAVIAVARRFANTDPRFTLSTTGFHSTAHLLALLRLGRTYISCFYGDTYPTPRPNPLYTTLLREGAALEHWTLLSYIAALRAAAMGHPYAVTTDLAGTDVGRGLEQAGRYLEIPDPTRTDSSVPLVAALRPDITFVHGAIGSDSGAIVAFPPYGEGFASAVSARTGVIATVERIVDESTLMRYSGAVVLPPGQVLAICPVPGGALPQPLYTPPNSGLPSYRDDTAAYLWWRKMATEPELLSRFIHDALNPPQLPAVQKAFTAQQITAIGTSPGDSPTTAQEAAVLRAAQAIVHSVHVRGHRRILAGIGQAFLAARLAHLWLARTGLHLPVMIETGLYGVECGPDADPFLLGHRNIAQAARLTSIDDILGMWACGAGRDTCLAVIGAAQIDQQGQINSTWRSPQTVLVGSGGAADLAAHAAEIIVLTRCAPDRLVTRVDYVTSPGRAVHTIATDLCTLQRTEPHSTSWTATTFINDPQTAAAIKAACPWPALTLDSTPTPLTDTGLAELRHLADDNRLTME